MISLHYIVVDGDVPESQDATIFFTGGPGQSGRSVLSDLSFQSFRDAVLGTGDAIVLAQRGTEFTSAYWPMMTEAEIIGDASKENTRLGFTTAASAMDIDQFREHMGYSTLNLVGISYGTRLAREYMRRYDSHVRAAVLDSASYASGDFHGFDSSGLFLSMGALDKSCANNEFCFSNYGSLMGLLFDALNEVNERPFEYGGSLTIDTKNLLSILLGLFYNKNNIPYIPELLWEIANSEIDSVATWAFDKKLNSLDYYASSFPVGMYYSIRCGDNPTSYDGSWYLNEVLPWMKNEFPSLIDEIELHQTRMEEYALDGTGYYDNDGCEDWSGSRIEGNLQPILSDKPTLLLGGEFDAKTTTYHAKRVEEELRGSNNRSVVFSGASHNVLYKSECATGIAAHFLTHLDSDLDVSCASHGQLDWDVWGSESESSGTTSAHTTPPTSIE